MTPPSIRRGAPCRTIPFCRGAPWALFASAPSGSVETTPYPVIAVPGSIPRTITGRGGKPSCLRHRRHVHVEVRVHLLHVVEFFERLDQLQQCLGIPAFDAYGTLRNPRKLSRRRLEPDLRERLRNRV